MEIWSHLEWGGGWKSRIVACGTARQAWAFHLFNLSIHLKTTSSPSSTAGLFCSSSKRLASEDEGFNSLNIFISPSAIMAADVDTSFIAAAYSFPESSLQTLFVAPTADLVKAFFEQAEIKARECQALEAEKLRTEVELETVVRSSDARARQLKDAVEKGLKEIESLRVKLSQEGTFSSRIWQC